MGPNVQSGKNGMGSNVHGTNCLAPDDTGVVIFVVDDDDDDSNVVVVDNDGADNGVVGGFIASTQTISFSP